MMKMTGIDGMNASTSIPSFAFHWKTPDGTTNVIIEDTSPPRIQVFIGKNGSSVASWAFAVAELVNLALESATLEEVIETLTEITTQNSTWNASGVECRSTPEAIAFSLLEYKKILARQTLAKSLS